MIFHYIPLYSIKTIFHYIPLKLYSTIFHIPLYSVPYIHIRCCLGSTKNHHLRSSAQIQQVAANLLGLPSHWDGPQSHLFYHDFPVCPLSKPTILET